MLKHILTTFTSMWSEPDAVAPWDHEGWLKYCQATTHAAWGVLLLLCLGIEAFIFMYHGLIN